MEETIELRRRIGELAIELKQLSESVLRGSASSGA
jgi:hypothetical protein